MRGYCSGDVPFSSYARGCNHTIYHPFHDASDRFPELSPTVYCCRDHVSIKSTVVYCGRQWPFTSTIDCEACPVITTASYNRWCEVSIDSHCRRQCMVPTHPSIAFAGENTFQPMDCSTRLPQEYVGVNYRHKAPTTIYRETCLSTAIYNFRPIHCTILYCYCSGHCLAPRVYSLLTSSNGRSPKRTPNTGWRSTNTRDRLACIFP